MFEVFGFIFDQDFWESYNIAKNSCPLINNSSIIAISLTFKTIHLMLLFFTLSVHLYFLYFYHSSCSTCRYLIYLSKNTVFSQLFLLYTYLDPCAFLNSDYGQCDFFLCPRAFFCFTEEGCCLKSETIAALILHLLYLNNCAFFYIY